MSFEIAQDYHSLLFPATLPRHISHSLPTLPIPNMICPLFCHTSLPVLCAADATGTPWKAFYHNTPTPHGYSILLKLTDRNIRMGEYIALNKLFPESDFLLPHVLVQVTWGEGSQVGFSGLLTGSGKATNKKPCDSATCFQYTVSRYTVSQVIK